MSTMTPTMTPALAVMATAGTSLANSAGVRKAAILMVNLGQERAAAVLKHMNDAEVEAITAQISQLDMISGSETDDVLLEFHQMMVARAHIAQGGFGFAQQLLQNSIGESGRPRSSTGCTPPRCRCPSSSCTGPTRRSCAASSPRSTPR